ncbi:hypothetical protein QTJ16_006751 [Diplocarpon rosae]|uniref:Uncharacterized protein n=1 Tax=Diplocarpon rosae TaxID=946125 RepID=A0AAD9SVC2_9HELO|nr:hypothetical protein QTJ16_006751 [Diplocarpon rosae]
MAGRSFKPASFLALNPSRSPRPTYTRTSSSSSTLSTPSEDSLGGRLREERERCTTPEHTRSYRPHPFHPHHFSFSPESPMMSPAFSPSSETTPTMSTSFAFPPAFAPGVPDTLRIPRGKYHPANYPSPAATGVTPPPSTPRAARPLAHLALPLSASHPRRDRADRPQPDRTSSEVKRKLQQYQRDMIAQARDAASSTRAKTRERAPISPRLLPLASPGPITPFELEEADGYLVAGSSETRKENERQVKRLLSQGWGPHGNPLGRL